jgi:hypothetical protein
MLISLVGYIGWQLALPSEGGIHWNWNSGGGGRCGGCKFQGSCWASVYRFPIEGKKEAKSLLRLMADWTFRSMRVTFSLSCSQLSNNSFHRKTAIREIAQ